MITLQNKNEVVSLKSSPKGRKSSQKVAQNPAIVYFLSKHIDVGTQNDRLDEKTQNMITLQNKNEVVSRKSSPKGRKSSQKIAQNPAIVNFLSKHIDVGTQNDRLDEKTQNMITLQNTNEVVSRKSSQKGRVLLTLDHSVRPPLSFRGRTPSFMTRILADIGQPRIMRIALFCITSRG